MTPQLIVIGPTYCALIAAKVLIYIAYCGYCILWGGPPIRPDFLTREKRFFQFYNNYNKYNKYSIFSKVYAGLAAYCVRDCAQSAYPLAPHVGSKAEVHSAKNVGFTPFVGALVVLPTNTPTIVGPVRGERTHFRSHRESPKGTIMANDKVNDIGGDKLKGEWYRTPELAAAIANEDQTVMGMQSVHNDLRTGYEKIVKALRTENPTATADGHFLDIMKKSDRWINECARRSEMASNGAKAELDKLDREMSDTLGIEETSRANEIRAYFERLKSRNERIAAARAAIEGFDKETMGAILSAPAYLSGLSNEDVDMLRKLYAQRHAPKALARKAAIERAIAVNADAFNEALIALGALFPKDRVASINARIAAAQAAKDDILAM